jgi:hypothetical protein
MSGSQQIILGGSPQAAAVDPYFYSVTSLLHGDGTNGAQNNTFLDSSTNNFTITRNGNTTQGSFSPFSQTGWGNYFDGSGDYLVGPNNAALNFSTGDFCVEMWVYPSDLAFRIFLSSADNSGTQIGYDPGNGPRYLYFYNNTNVFSGQTGGFVANQWNHLALCRSGTTLSFYCNGNRVYTNTSYSTSVSFTTPYIGEFNALGYPFLGYISNLRMVKGSSVYTPSSSTLTVPTSPLTSITNTSLLTCQANRFLDASSNAFAITANGDVSVQPFSPFNPLTPYSTSAVGGSGYFDGSGDYLDTSSSSSAFAIGTGQFTVEAWVYGSDTSWALISSTTSGGLVFGYNIDNGSQGLGIWKAGVGPSVTTGQQLTYNAWSHIAATRDGSNNVRIFVNGVQVGATTSDTTNYGTANQVFRVGADGILPGSFSFAGHLTDARVVKGSAVYTSAFTPPTAPLTAIANTSLLLNFTNAGIYDATSKNDLETVGNAQISTTQSKFGGSSIAFDGSGDYLLGPWNPPTDLGAGDFTIEFWMYPTAAGQSSLTYLFNLATNANYGPILIGQAVSGYGIVLYASSTGSSWNLASGSSFGTATQNAWNHVALTRYGADVRLFLNGIAATTLNWGTTALLTGSSYRPNIGSGGGVANTFYTGYMQDVRMTKGIARYTSNFTPPTTAFLTL